MIGMGNDMIISIHDVNVHYGGVHALRGVNMQICRGEFVALIGSNGAGKSSLLRTISGLKRATSGSIVFDGNDISKVAPNTIVGMGIGHCIERRHVFRKLTVADNLWLGAYTIRKDHKAIARNLEMVYNYFPKLRERRKQMSGTLSGGEQQMLAVGRALMARPKLLMLDEPSLGLAPVIVQDLARIFTQMNRDGMTILLVEQNSVLALRLAQRIYVLETGTVVKEGCSEELMKDDSLRKAYLGVSN